MNPIYNKIVYKKEDNLLHIRKDRGRRRQRESKREHKASVIKLKLDAYSPYFSPEEILMPLLYGKTCAE